ADHRPLLPIADLPDEQHRHEPVEVVRILELGQMSLDESLNYWERGEELAAYCEKYLDGATTRIAKALAARENAGQGGSPQDDASQGSSAQDGAGAQAGTPSSS